MIVGAGGHFCPVARYLGADARHENAVIAQETEFEMTPLQCKNTTIGEQTPELYFCPDMKGYGWCFRKNNFLNVGSRQAGCTRTSRAGSPVPTIPRENREIGFSASYRNDRACVSAAAAHPWKNYRRRGTAGRRRGRPGIHAKRRRHSACDRVGLTGGRRYYFGWKMLRHEESRSVSRGNHVARRRIGRGLDAATRAIPAYRSNRCDFETVVGNEMVLTANRRSVVSSCSENRDCL